MRREGIVTVLFTKSSVAGGSSSIVAELPKHESDQVESDAGSEKYDATATNMIALLKYESGLPFNRLEGLQRNVELDQ